jgi:hypothetical protein
MYFWPKEIAQALIKAFQKWFLKIGPLFFPLEDAKEENWNELQCSQFKFFFKQNFLNPSIRST